ncbi:MAG TPA: basic amino acid ABC transporter substrate-binding protein [Candidatus Ornithomonoglobus intestinigallinarum]|jgi:ABC-type amino acid transport substrate-binding protein|uniref:Basic amino acid ABC transporter substrate-binding protein n=1 Tax=Candidatus Ornithomonoglobus intestinigallinarum TaxID=2840894 RepID=A0A9D1H1I0_9FIRM|nr:basic amino acid ABC transporter substrate-binding protein [Candidatus Ornithomonoglobus intestinigallinarum]
MKKFVKLAALAAAAVMGASSLAGCGSDDTLVMGTNAAFPPFEYTTTNGLVDEFDGIDVAIAKKIAESMGKQLTIEDMEFDGLVASVSTGKVDMAVAGMTVTPERLENVDFSDPYYVATQVMVVAADDDTITKAEDLKNGKKVGVVLGYTGDTIVTETLQIPEENIVRANRGIDVVQDVKNGKLDAVVLDSATGKALAENNGLKVVEDPEVFESEEYAIAVQKGNTELLDQINEVLSEMTANGEIEALAEKYDGAAAE